MKRVFILLTSGAFLALILLIVVLTANSVYQLAQAQKQIDESVELHDRKLEILSRIELAAFLRADRLMRMVIEADPFARDALYMEYNRAGYMIGSGRQELARLGMGPNERKLFNAQAELIGRIVAMQEKVVNYTMHDRVDDARNTLIAEGIPLQEHLGEMLNQHRAILQLAHNDALQETRVEYKKSRFTTLAFGVAAALLGLALGWLTLRRLSIDAHEIERQMTELEISHAALELEASHDAMTGLANRKLFYEQLKHALLQAKRYNSKVGVLFVDLDNFKTVNDLYGHHVGDVLLAEVASRLTASLREADMVARAGGDEFLILLGNVGSEDDCLIAMERIEAALESKAIVHDIELSISASIGHAIYPADGVTEDDLIRAADASMYRIKHGQRKS